MSTSINPPPDETFLDTAEVAVMCGVEPVTVARWRTKARAQPLAFHSIGGRRLYRKADVMAFIAAGRCQPGKG